MSVLAVRPTRVLFLTYPGAPTPNQSPADASLHMKLMENMVRVLASKNLMLNEKLRCLSRALHTRKTAGLSVLPGQSCQQPYFFHSL